MTRREIRITFQIDTDVDELDFLAKLYERLIEEAAQKVWTGKVFTKKAMEELEARKLDAYVQSPIVFFGADGEIERAASDGFDGRDTAADAPGEFDDEEDETDDLADEVAEKFRQSGLEVSPSGLVTKKE